MAKLKPMTIRAPAELRDRVDRLIKSLASDKSKGLRLIIEKGCDALEGVPSSGSSNPSRAVADIDFALARFPAFEDFSEVLRQIPRMTGSPKAGENLCSIIVKRFKDFGAEQKAALLAAHAELGRHVALSGLNQYALKELKVKLEKSAGMALTDKRNRTMLILSKAVEELLK